MIKRTFLLVGLTIFFNFLVFPSCKKDDGGDSVVRDNYIGSWICQETSQSTGASTYTVHIIAHPSNATDILIENFYNLGFPNKPYAITNGSFFTIPSQQILGNIVEGEGTLQGDNTITMSYSVFDGIANDSVTAVLTRQ